MNRGFCGAAIGMPAALLDDADQRDRQDRVRPTALLAECGAREAACKTGAIPMQRSWCLPAGRRPLGRSDLGERKANRGG